MADLAWPQGLMPWKVMFHLQPHVGGQESPITRTTKRYGLSAPRWIARLAFRGGYDGAPRLGEVEGFGPQLDAFIADLEGGLNAAVFHDFRRPYPTQRLYGAPVIAQAAVAGASSMVVGGLVPHGLALSVGDYIGGDGRPHLVSRAKTLAAGGIVSGAGTVMADAGGVATIGFNPPLSSAIAAGTALRWPVTGRFDIVDPDAAGQNETGVGEMTEYVIDFQERLL